MEKNRQKELQKEAVGYIQHIRKQRNIVKKVNIAQSLLEEVVVEQANVQRLQEEVLKNQYKYKYYYNIFYSFLFKSRSIPKIVGMFFPKLFFIFISRFNNVLFFCILLINSFLSL